MFYIQVFFEDDKIKFNFAMDFLKIQKNEDDYLIEIDKVKRFCFKNSQSINFEYIIEEFNKFRNSFSSKYLINNKFNSKVEFKIFYNSCNNKDEIIKFIENNKNLNIILYTDDYFNIINNLKNNYYPNLKIKFDNSEKPIPYKEFYDMYNKLDEIVKFINHYNLTPLEKVFLVYDIVKANIYNKEEKSEHYSKSRDLNQVVNGDKIVCVGYANLINYLLTNLNIKNQCVIIFNKEKKVGHQINYLYLEDDNYDIKGVFFLDVTADSRKNDNYIDNYKYFLKPFNFFNFKKIEILQPTELSLLNKSNEDICDNLLNNNDNNLSNLLKLLNFINVKYSLLALISQVINDKSKLIEITNLVKKEYNPKLSVKNFKTALYKVRRIEYINDIVKTDLSNEYIEEVFNKNFKIDEGIVRLMRALNLSDELDFNEKLAKIGNIKTDSLRLRFLKDLKLYLNDIPNNGFIKKMKK